MALIPSTPGTSNLNFTTTNCEQAYVTTLVAGLPYLDYIFGYATIPAKDFKDIKKYTITYSKDCQSDISKDIAPNYTFSLIKLGCSTVGTDNTYVVQLNGVNGNLINSFKFGPTGAAVVHPFVNTLGVITFEIVANKVTASLVYDIEIVTTASKNGVTPLVKFTYSGSLTIAQDVSINCGWNGTFALPTPGTGELTIPLTTPATNPPLPITQTNAPYTPAWLNLNDLFNLPNLTPAFYKVKICEVDFNDTEFCLEGQEFIDCHSTPCVDAGLCDPTEDVCNVILEAKKQHEAMIYGLDCCNETKRNLLTHYIRIYCSSEATCL